MEFLQTGSGAMTGSTDSYGLGGTEFSKAELAATVRLFDASDRSAFEESIREQGEAEAYQQLAGAIVLGLLVLDGDPEGVLARNAVLLNAPPEVNEAHYRHMCYREACRLANDPEFHEFMSDRVLDRTDAREGVVAFVRSRVRHREH
jgi:hypothetical protein